MLSFQFEKRFLKLIIGVRRKASASNFYGGQDSVVGIAFRYGLGGPGLTPTWGRDLPDPSRPAPRPTQPSIQ